jgi:alpha-galactosidase
MRQFPFIVLCLVLGGFCRSGRTSEPTTAAPFRPALSPPQNGDDPDLLARTPPMGWNSWDSYGTTINEADFRTNAQWFARHLKRFGWQYVVIDAEWFVANPTPAGSSKDSKFILDAFGRHTPAPQRFPSSANNAGFGPLAAYIHSLGLKFGIHILRGVPKLAVANHLPIEGSSLTADEAADTSDLCPWNPDNYGTNASHPAAQAYYDSIARLYASWDVDLIKVDCISSRPYKGDDIRMLRVALNKTGRPIVLSLSPGAAPLEKADEMRRYAEMWRISDDVWDLWHSDVAYPQGIGDQFPRVAKWAAMAQTGHWPDADMLPIGYLGPAPGWGQARQSRLTHDEQRTLMTLWCVARSPLMIGANLTMSDTWTTVLLTNPEVLAVDQHSTDNRPVLATDETVVWTARPEGSSEYYLAILNLENIPQEVRYEWTELGLPKASYSWRDLWEHKTSAAASSLSLTLPPHGAALLRTQIN